MIKGVELREKLAHLVASSLAIPAGAIAPEKIDSVDKFPAARLYLRPMESVPEAMNGVRERTYRIEVAIYRDTKKEDISPELARDQGTFEAAVEKARKDGELEELVESIFMSSAAIEVVPDSNNQKGILRLTFEAERIAQLEID